MKTLGSNDNPPAKDQGPSARRRQLHILYVLNDLLHHTKYHADRSASYSTLTGNLQQCLVDLFGVTSAYSLNVYASHHDKIRDILDIWERCGYYQPSYIQKLRDTTVNAARLGCAGIVDGTKQTSGFLDEAAGKDKKDAPYIMPAFHGDPSAPFFDLPAGNMMPHIIPNSTVPLNPQLVKPLQFVAGPADESLVTAVKIFLDDVDGLQELGFPDEGSKWDIDEMGHGMLRDEATGDVLEGEGYYGWSRAFCEKMKKVGESFGDYGKATNPGDSHDGRLSPRKRQRYSYSQSNGSRDRSRSMTRSRSRSREQGRFRSLRSQSHSRSRSRSYSPRQTVPQSQPPLFTSQEQPQPRMQTQGFTAPARAQPQGPSPPPPPPPPFTQGFPIGPGGVPIPPRPPNYNGPWPPPPPPSPAGPRAFQSQAPPPFAAGPQAYQMVPNPGGWGGVGQHPAGPGRGIPITASDQLQPAYNGNIQKGNGNDRGYGREGWIRQG